jgi:hypothetical protein
MDVAQMCDYEEAKLIKTMQWGNLIKPTVTDMKRKRSRISEIFRKLEF